MASDRARPPVPPRPPSPPPSKPQRGTRSAAPPVPPRPQDVRSASDVFYRRSNDTNRPRHLTKMAQTFDRYAAYNDIPRFATPGPARYMTPAPSPPVGFNQMHDPRQFPMAPYSSAAQLPANVPARWAAPQPVRQASSFDVGGLAASMGKVALHEGLSNAKSVRGIIEYPTPAPSRQTARIPMPRAASVPPQAHQNQKESLTAPLPTTGSLQAALSAVQGPDASPGSQIAWIRDVLLLVNRDFAKTADANAPSTPFAPDEFPKGPAHISDPALASLAEGAVPLLISLAPYVPEEDEQSASGSRPSSSFLSPAMAEALHLRAALTSAGIFPTHLPASARYAFSAFTAAARSGHSRSWARLARDYENFGDVAHSLSCIERGASLGDPACLHRLGIALLLGQLGLERDVERGLSALRSGADAACVGCAEPAYAYALVFLRSSGVGGEDDAELVVANVPRVSRAELAPFLPVGMTPARVGAKYLARAAYLHCVPAQRRLARAYECGGAPWVCDPALSVRWYARAGANGDVHADAALGRWFLAGAPGVFEADETKARAFAEKAAKRNVREAQFAIGYCCEVGVGAPRDLDEAMSWYEKAAAQGSEDAFERLSALMQPAAKPLERTDHEAIAVHGVKRQRTIAQRRAQRASAIAGEEVADSRTIRWGSEDIRRPPILQQRALSFPQQQLTPPDSFSSLPAWKQEQFPAQQPPPRMPPDERGFFPPQPQRGYGPPASQNRPSFETQYSQAPYPRPPSAAPIAQQQYPPRQSSMPAALGQPPSGPMHTPRQQRSLPPEGYERDFAQAPFVQSQQWQQQVQQFANRPRFTLVDDGPASDAMPVMRSRRTASSSSNGSVLQRRARNDDYPGWQQEGDDETGDAQAKQPTKYATFAEMGIEARKAEDKECVIM